MCCRLWQRSVNLQTFWDFKRNPLSVEAGLFSAGEESTDSYLSGRMTAAAVIVAFILATFSATGLAETQLQNCAG